MWNINEQLAGFFTEIAQGNVEVYNEFSLQHELGCYLLSNLTDKVLIQFERPASFFGVKNKLTKKEVDIALFLPDQTYKVAIELKYPKNGQHPEQMFKACQGIAFLEQLCSEGFDTGYFVMVADDPLFYVSGGIEGIYKHFRAGIPICGYIQKPTGAKDESVTLCGSHIIKWRNIVENRRYVAVQIQKAGPVDSERATSLAVSFSSAR